MQFIKTFKDGSYLKFDKGNFDQWGVFMVEITANEWMPLDTQYFKDLKFFADKYGVEKIYSDFCTIYSLTEKEINNSILNFIEIQSTYFEESLKYEKMMTILYAAMIAEENKENAILGKRIKRLGVHYYLIENKPLKESANCMRGIDWRTLDKICKERGF